MKKFNVVDEEFICENCGNTVKKLGYSSRDHCNKCLFSKHVDINPGDRLNNCLGLLKPIGVEKFRDTFKIIYKCCKCNKTHKNIVANDDNMDEIIKISINND